MREAEKKRLIELIKQGDKAFADKYTGEVMSHIDELYEFIADYLLDNGAIAPKFKAGDKVFVISSDSYFEGEVKGLMDASLIYAHKKHAYLIRPEGEYLMYADEKDIFISKAEVEYALKNRRSVSLINGHIEE